MNKKYTSEHIEYIAANITGRSYQELTNMFNKQFGLILKPSAMISLAFRHGLRNERDTRFKTGWEPTQFKKGHIPFNKGKKKWYQGGEKTQFKPGHKPWNYRPVGSERINADGYIEVKIADPKTWKGKHLVIWEEANGPVPQGHVVIFVDGNTQNVNLKNLMLISRRKLAIINKMKLISSNPELTKAGIIIADIYLKMSERKQKSKR